MDRPGPRAVLLLSCEHGGARVPPRYAHLFASKAAQAALASHRGSDIGALDVARRLSRTFDAPLLTTTVSRLLVDTNRSEGHPQLFSEFSSSLTADERHRVLSQYHRAHRDEVETTIRAIQRRGRPVLHLAVHSFTPVWKGENRTVDIGLLYDPQRQAERRLCAMLSASLKTAAPHLRVRKNSPYRGTADGLTTALRRRLPKGYAGVELELKQSLITSPTERREMARRIAAGLDQLNEVEPV